MTRARRRQARTLTVVMALPVVALSVAVLLLGGCVAAGYSGSVGVGYGVDYYEPYGYDYGGWGPGYYVGPPGPAIVARPRPAPRPAPRPPAYRPAPPARTLPSIPTRPRSAAPRARTRPAPPRRTP